MTDGGSLFGSRHEPRLGETGEFQKQLGYWLQDCYMADLTEDTLKTYSKMLRWFCQHLETLDPAPAFKEIESYHISGYLASIKKRGVAPRTVKGRFAAIHTFFAWAKTEKYLKINPAAEMKRPRAPKRPKRFLTREEFEKILKECYEDTFLGVRRLAMFRLLLTSGIRQRELVKLDRDDLYFQRGLVLVRYGKGQKQRQATFAKSAQRAMKTYLRWRDEKPDSFPGLWVNCLIERQPMTYRGIENDIRRVFSYAGVEIKDKAHSFRRTFAANLLGAKIDREYVQTLGGWETASMLDQYVSWKKTENDKALEAVRNVDPWS